MTGAEHFAEAERLAVASADTSWPLDYRLVAAGTAQIHATLALAAAVERQNRLAHGTDAGGYGA